MVALQPIFRKAYWSLVGFGAIYGTFLLSVTFKSTQRQYGIPPCHVMSNVWYERNADG